MENNKHENLELRSEKMRRLIGDIPRSLELAGYAVITISMIVLGMVVLML